MFSHEREGRCWCAGRHAAVNWRAQIFDLEDAGGDCENSAFANENSSRSLSCGLGHGFSSSERCNYCPSGRKLLYRCARRHLREEIPIAHTHTRRTAAPINFIPWNAAAMRQNLWLVFSFFSLWFPWIGRRRDVTFCAGVSCCLYYNTSVKRKEEKQKNAGSGKSTIWFAGAQLWMN